MICFLSPYGTWHFLEFYTHGIIRCVFFLSAFVHQHTYFEIPMLPCVQTVHACLSRAALHCLFIHIPLKGAFGVAFSFQLQTKLREHSCKSLYEYMLSFLWSKCLGVDWLDHRNCQAVFQSGCSILYSQESCRSIPVAPHPCQHSLWLGLLTARAVLTDVWRGLTVVYFAYPADE